MAFRHTGRALTAHFGPPGKDRRSPTGYSRRANGRPLNAKQSPESTAGDGSKDFTPSWVADIEQWICFVLGVICIACGALGVFAKQVKGPPSGSIAWLGSAYVPALRLTALLCLFMGLLLARRGWSRSRSRTERSEHEGRN